MPGWNVLGGFDKRGVQHGRGDDVTGEGLIVLAGRQCLIFELIADDGELVVDGGVAVGGDSELGGDTGGKRAAGGSDGVAEVAMEHLSSRIEGILRQEVASILWFVGGEPERLVAAVVEFGNPQRASG